MSFATDIGFIQTRPTSRLGDLERITALLDRAEPRVRRRFLELVEGSRSLASLERVSDLIARGRIEEALRLVDDIGPGVATALEQAYAAAGLSAAAALRSTTDRFLDFNTLNARSLSSLQVTRARLVAEITSNQRAALMDSILEGVGAGLRPDQIARDFRSTIGLTQHQRRIVANYRRALEDGSARALSRQLRDRRFDGSVSRALASRGADRVPLTPAQIDRMTERYRQKFVALRADTIARTETTQAVAAGDHEMFQQAIDEGAISASALKNVWITAGDERVRSSHRAMNGQQRPFGQPFTSGDGNSLRFPGDPNAPGSDTINCRCVIRRTLSRRGQR